MRGRAEPTWTHLVEEVLRGCDDFMDSSMLMKATGGSRNQISAACHSLRAHRVVDVVINADGHGWWFARPKEEDNRLFKQVERVPEAKPRRPRRSRVKTQKPPM